MSTVGIALRALAAEIAGLSARLGRPVRIDPRRAADRRGHLVLRPPGLWSPNRSCRLVRAADGWIAVNLPREEDRELVPAWLQADAGQDAWPTILATARTRPWRRLTADARLLGLPVAGVGEADPGPLAASLVAAAPGARAPRGRALRVVDLSALWAGPLCGAVLADMGADVVKIEHRGRPDPTRTATPGFFQDLNGRKADLPLDFGRPADRARLHDEILAADVVITSARPRAFPPLGLDPAGVFARNPGLVWVAISGHGWTGEAADRVAFGDDAAAAGGLVRWTAQGGPRFLGDALADPITGLAAAAGALKAVLQGGGVIVDAALARCAAGAAAMRPARAA